MLNHILCLPLFAFICKDILAIQYWTERPNGWKVIPGRGCGNLIPIKFVDSMDQDKEYSIKHGCLFPSKLNLPKSFVDRFSLTAIKTLSESRIFFA